MHGMTIYIYFFVVFEHTGLSPVNKVLIHTGNQDHLSWLVIQKTTYKWNSQLQPATTFLSFRQSASYGICLEG